MRKVDKEKQANEKAQKTINFDKPVLDAIEERARKLNTTASFLVNTFCRRNIMRDESFYTEMMKYHWTEFQKYQFMKEQLAAEKELNAIAKEDEQ